MKLAWALGLGGAAVVVGALLWPKKAMALAPSADLPGVQIPVGLALSDVDMSIAMSALDAGNCCVSANGAGYTTPGNGMVSLPPDRVAAINAALVTMYQQPGTTLYQALGGSN